MARDVYQEVTDQIIEALEQGTAPWARPWSSTAEPPHNASSGRAYSGINEILLSAAAMTRGYELDRWLTYRQAQEAGGQVRKGERGQLVTFFKVIEREKGGKSTTGAQERGGESREEEKEKIPIVKGFTVFNVAQIDGLPEHYYESPAPREQWEREEEAEGLLEASGADIRHGGDQAYYMPSQDRIQLPPRGAFESAQDYYATALHELVHWTKHPERLDRDMGKQKFGDEGYAREELVAEMGAAMLCARAGFGAELRHADYIGHWMQVLRDDKRAIFQASSRAREASEYVYELYHDRQRNSSAEELLDHSTHAGREADTGYGR